PGKYESHYQMMLCAKRLNDDAAIQDEQQKLRAIKADKDQVVQWIAEIRDRPNDNELRFRIGETYFRIGEDLIGQIWVHKLLILDAQHAGAHRLLAEYYERAKQTSRSQAHREFLSSKGVGAISNGQ